MDLLSLYLSYPFFRPLTELNDFWRIFYENGKIKKEVKQQFKMSSASDSKDIATSNTDWGSSLRDEIDLYIKIYLQIIKLDDRKRYDRSLRNVKNIDAMSLGAIKAATLDNTLWGLLKAVRDTSAHSFNLKHNAFSVLIPQLREKVRTALGSVNASSYWNKKFPSFSLFAYSIAYQNELHLNELKDYFPNLNVAPKSIPGNFTIYIEKLIELIKEQLENPSELYWQSYESVSDGLIAFFKRPLNTLHRNDRNNVLFLFDKENLKVQVFRTNEARTAVHILKDEIGLMIESEIETLPRNITKSFAIILTDDIGYSLLEFKEMMQNSPISIYVFTTDNCSYKDIREGVDAFSQQNESMTLRPRNIAWQNLSRGLQESMEVFLCDEKCNSAKIKLGSLSTDNNCRVYNNLNGERLLSMIHQDTCPIFHSCLPPLAKFYFPRSLQIPNSIKIIPEKRWLEDVMLGLVKSPIILSDVSGSGKLSLLSSIGRQLVKDKYIVRFNTLESILPNLSDNSDLDEICQAIWNDSKFASDVAHHFLCDVKLKMAFPQALLINVGDETSKIPKLETFNILRNIISKTHESMLLIIACEPSFATGFSRADESTWELDRLLWDVDQIDFLKGYWINSLELEEEAIRTHNSKLQGIAYECVQAYSNESMIELPMYCMLIANVHMKYVSDKINDKAVNLQKYSLSALYEILVDDLFARHVLKHFENSSWDGKTNEFVKPVLRVMDLTHQFGAVTKLTGHQSKVLCRLTFDIIRYNDCIKYGSVVNDSHTVNYFCARFAMNLITNDNIPPFPGQILRNILRISDSNCSFHHEVCVRLLEDMLSKTNKAATRSCIESVVQMDQDSNWIHSVVMAAIKAQFISLYSVILCGLEESCRHDLLEWITTPLDVEIPLNDLVEQFHLSISRSQLIVTKYFVEIINLDINCQNPLSGVTALHKVLALPDAAKYESFLKYFLSKGANLEIQDKLGEKPIDILRVKHRNHFCKVLVEIRNQSQVDMMAGLDFCQNHA